MAIETREPVDAASALVATHRAVDHLLDALGGADPDARSHTPGDLARLEGEITRAVNRLESARLRVGSLMTHHREAGAVPHLDEGQFFARGGRRDLREARRDAALARELGHGPAAPVGGLPVEPAHDRPDTAGGAAVARTPTGVALDRGLLSSRHAEVIHRALRDLPDDVTAPERQRVEEHLVERAQRLSPSALRSAARRALEALERPAPAVDAHEARLVEAEEQAAWRKTRASITHRDDGTSVLHAVLPTLPALALERVLQAMVSPSRRTRPGEQAASSAGGRAPSPAAAPAAHGSDDWREQQEDFMHLRGLALAELVERVPTDHLHNKVAATVVVHTDLTTLRGETDRVGVTDGAHRISPGEVRRLAAAAGIIPSVLGGDSLPLDLGTQRRFFSDAQRVVLSRIYDECAAAECDRPFSWCQVHHDQPWAARRGSPGDGWAGEGVSRARGRTDLRNAIPLCGRHNRLVEAPGVRHSVEREADGRAVVHFDCSGVPSHVP